MNTELTQFLRHAVPFRSDRRTCEGRPTAFPEEEVSQQPRQPAVAEAPAFEFRPVASSSRERRRPGS